MRDGVVIPAPGTREVATNDRHHMVAENEKSPAMKIPGRAAGIISMGRA